MYKKPINSSRKVDVVKYIFIPFRKLCYFPVIGSRTILMFISLKTRNHMKLLYEKCLSLLGDYMYCGMIDKHVEPFYLSFFVTGYVLPLCLICLLYVMIVCHLNKHKMPTNPTKNDKNRHRTSHVFKVCLLYITQLDFLFIANQNMQSWSKMVHHGST